MSQVADRSVTLEGFLGMPEAKPAREFIDGRIIQKVSPRAKHSLMQGKLVTKINRKTETKKIGLAFPELRCTFAGRSLVFDVSYFRWERIPLDQTGEPIDDVFLPPDFAIEILSPGQRESHPAELLDFAVRNGVKLGWLVNPRTRQVKVFRAGQRAQTCDGDDVLDTEKLAAGFRCTVAELFGWLRIA